MKILLLIRCQESNQTMRVSWIQILKEWLLLPKECPLQMNFVQPKTKTNNSKTGSRNTPKMIRNFKPKLSPCADAQDTLVWTDGSTNPPKILVPTKYQRNVFDYFHGISHMGYKACYKLLGQTHYWPNLRKDIQAWTRTCQSCQRNKVTRHTTTFLQQLPDPTKRFSHLHVDLLGPFGGDTMLLTIIDRWTNWPEAIPIQKGCCTAKDLAENIVKHWISKFGVPMVITSDRGRQFTSLLWTEMNKILGIKQSLTNFIPSPT